MKKLAVILIILPCFLLTGCWDAREINELAFVLSIGLDKTDNGFKVTAQIASPETYSKTSSGTGSTQNKPFWIVTSTGKTIFEAIRNMASKSSRRIFWAHIKVIVISEKLAKGNTLEIFDFFTRNPELRLRTLIAVTPDEAEDVIKIQPEMEKDPAVYLEKVIENKSLTGKSCSIMLKDFIEDYLDAFTGPVVSRLVIEKSGAKPIVKTSGAYVFDGDKLSVPLDEIQTRGLLWIKNKMDGSIMVVNCPEDGNPVTLEIKKADSSMKSQIESGIPHFIINVKAEANITEQSCVTDFNDSKYLDGLSKALEKAIASDIQSTIAAAQDIDIDFPALNSVLHTQHKEQWHDIESDWSRLFKNSQVTVTAKVTIHHISLAKPLAPIKTK